MSVPENKKTALGTFSLQPSYQLHHSYDVIFTRKVFDAANPVLVDSLLGAGEGQGKPSGLFFVLDRNLLQARPSLLHDMESYCEAHNGISLSGPPLVLPGGEECKNDPLCLQQIYRAVADYRIDRHSYMVAVGGGALIDVVGFAAATAHRGIRLIRIPTTVLAQNDASVGVKNSINFEGRKNFIGSFAPPVAVINDLDMLPTLSDRDLRSGMAEAVKVALIRDGAFFRWMEAHRGQLARFEEWTLEHMIHRCAELHLQQITGGGDPYESGSARPLDFGHWAAHKIEELSSHEIRHGEAVAMGMALDTVYSVRIGMMAEDEAARVLRLLRELGFALYSSWLEGLNIQAALQEFREHLGGELCITLLRELGRGEEVHTIDVPKMIQARKVLELYERAGELAVQRLELAREENGSSVSEMHNPVPSDGTVSQGMGLTLNGESN
ncbi:MAG: 3-dehydroquinate synthase [Leptospiraceae bacterium]|nr:3-dehydroquinate synthase [Leptospiraceae bacterium]